MTIFKPLVPDVEIPDNVPLFQFLLDKASKYPQEKPAMVDYASGFTVTYGQLPQFFFTVAKNLRDTFNVNKGDVVAFMLPNHPLFPVLFHGTNMAGGIVTPINPLYTADEINKQLLDSNAKIIITIPLFAENVLAGVKGTNVKTALFLRPKEQAASELPVSDDVETLDLLSTLLRPPTNKDFEQVSFNPKEDIAVLPYSSGTTGISKGVMLTHHNCVANGLQIRDLESFTQDDVLFGLLPLFHIYGFLLLCIRSLMDGTTVYYVPRFDFVQFLTVVQEKKVTRAHLVPPIILALANHPLVDKFDLSSLNGILSGAAPLSKELTEKLVNRLRKNNEKFVLRQGYGLTETSPVISASFPDKVVYGSSGVLVANTELRIVDPETGKDLDVDEEGEVVVRGPQVMKGYLGNDKATREMVRDGWLHTGDIGKMDNDGNLYITDRLKEMIKVSGHTIAPAEIEAVLLTHSGIGDCAVVGVKDEKAGERPKAFVVKKEGVELTEDEVKTYVADRVSPHKRIRDVEFIDAIPKSSSGKILRRLLRK
uniref:4-coumarate--CoA ligase n=1 Tax=Percolomonas cosmopolitus TaxID=63605 RepID=A0A7S1KM78_9EUKA